MSKTLNRRSGERNKAKEPSSMEKKEKGIHDILPSELIQRILLSVPANYLLCLRCVCKLWNSLISDPFFAESHLRLSLAPSYASIFRKYSAKAYFFRLQEVFNDDNYAVKEASFPSDVFRVMGSCRGFVLLNLDPWSLQVWNPLTGSSKEISCFCIVSRSKLPGFLSFFPRDAILFGFGYDESQDDYLVVVAWHDITNLQHHLDFFSLRANSWINIDSALPKPFGRRNWQRCGVFLNGAIHWLSCNLKAYSEAILIFDLKERSFSKISIPEPPVMCDAANLVLLGGCLAFCMYSHDSCEHKTYIWVMKEYKVQSSWTLYEIPCRYFEPLCLFTESHDIVALVNISIYRPLKFAKYNVRKELLQEFKCPETAYHRYEYPLDLASYSVYTESLLLLPGDNKHSDDDKKNNVM
ncbi:hypothetical protein PIB30_001456 [Stylosanthes scabra]|uniref:F-box domain-containing protein n=1 Tax=Stylosanthes scabra TaxID=79078 RepID=A0ABU6Q3T3_9FABA|nr:hypothetical protein [Stylosanthes scabra]